METVSDTFYIVPDVSPRDVWGDAACLGASHQGTGVMLPPKRVKPEQQAGSTGPADDDNGFRIGSRIPAHVAGEASPQLEVREFDGTVVRLQPEEPTAPRIQRQVVFHERPASEDESRLSGETRDWGSSKKQPVFWVLGTGAVVAAMVVGAISLLPLVNESNAARPRPGESELVLEAVANAEALTDMLARQAEAESIFHAFLSAPSAEAVLPLVRDPDEVAELIRNRDSPATASGKPARPKTLSWGARENQALTYGILAGTLPDYSEFEAYFTVSNGRLVMDWKASTAYGTADFALLKEKQGNPAEIRGWIESAEFYTLAFPENSFQAYQLASPDHQQILWVYAGRGSDIHKKLKTLIKGGYILEGRKDPQKVTVRLEHGSADSLPGHWEIVELLHKDWIAP